MTIGILPDIRGTRFMRQGTGGGAGKAFRTGRIARITFGLFQDCYHPFMRGLAPPTKEPLVASLAIAGHYA